MERKLYPLKFTPILKDKIWGGSKLKETLNKEKASAECGESWEISGVEGDVSEVKEGWLAGNTLEDVIEIYMGDLVGEKVFEKFGTSFPLLIKFIDACDNLSIQVHPDDTVAKKRHNSFGKTEMWYVMDSDKDAGLIVGFNKELDKEKYLIQLQENNLESIMNFDSVSKGDVYFIPAGRVHAIGKGTLLAEIQQTSDITYRIFDFNRKDKEGNSRELHTNEALDVIDFKFYDKYKTEYSLESNKTAEVIACEYFKTNVVLLDKNIDKDYSLIDSFVIYMCVEGEVDIKYDDSNINLKKGETVLIPADLNILSLQPKSVSKLLEVYIK